MTHRRVEQHLRPENVCRQKQFRLGDATVHMRFCCEVDDFINFIRREQSAHHFSVTDVGFLEMVEGICLELPKVLEIPCIRERIDVKNAVRWMFCPQVFYEI